MADPPVLRARGKLKRLSAALFIKTRLENTVKHDRGPWNKPTNTTIISCLLLLRQHGVAVVYTVVCWLIRRKARICIPGQASKRNMKRNISAATSSQIFVKTSESK